MSLPSVAPGRAIAALAGREATLVVRLPFLDWAGDLYAALMLDEGLFTSGRVGGDGWFARTDEDWAKLFRTTVYAVRSARARLLQMGVLHTKRQGMPKRTYYRFDPAIIEASFVAWLDSGGQAPGAPAEPAPLPLEGQLLDESTADSAAQSCESEGSVMRKRTTGHANPEAQSCENARPSIPAVKSLNQQTALTPADAGDAQARVAAPRPATQPPAAELAATTPQRALFAAVCAAGGWSPKDLTRGSREQLGQLVASLLTTPEAERPDADQLRATYQAELAALSGRLGRRVQGLTVLQFREAIGRWIAANRQEAADRQRLAEKALREAEDAARRRQERAAAEAAGPGLAHEGHEAWGRIARELRSRMSPATWASWLADAQPLALQDGVLTVQVASSYAVDWITQRLAAPLAALAEELGLEDLRFVPQELAREVRAA